MTSEPVAVCERVSKTYVSPSGRVPALRDVDAVIMPGAVTVIAGPSGSGKSTLLRLLACSDFPDEGSVVVDGHDTALLSTGGRRRLRRDRIGYVFPEPAANLFDYLTAHEHLMLAPRLRGAKPDPEEADRLLAAMGLEHRRDHLPRMLSGGEQQRLAFAFAAGGRPALLVADEPTAELDSTATERVLEAVRTLAATGVAVAVASHDPLVVDEADHVLRISDGVLEDER